MPCKRKRVRGETNDPFQNAIRDILDPLFFKDLVNLIFSFLDYSKSRYSIQDLIFWHPVTTYNSNVLCHYIVFNHPEYRVAFSIACQHRDLPLMNLIGRKYPKKTLAVSYLINQAYIEQRLEVLACLLSQPTWGVSKSTIALSLNLDSPCATLLREKCLVKLKAAQNSKSKQRTRWAVNVCKYLFEACVRKMAACNFVRWSPFYECMPNDLWHSVHFSVMLEQSPEDAFIHYWAERLCNAKNILLRMRGLDLFLNKTSWSTKMMQLWVHSCPVSRLVSLYKIILCLDRQPVNMPLCPYNWKNLLEALVHCAQELFGMPRYSFVGKDLFFTVIRHAAVPDVTVRLLGEDEVALISTVVMKYRNLIALDEILPGWVLSQVRQSQLLRA